MKSESKRKVLFIEGIADSGLVEIIELNPLRINTNGTCNVYSYLKDSLLDSGSILIDNKMTQKINLEDYDIFFNQISNSETHRIALQKVINLCSLEKYENTYCINHPSNVLLTTRDRISYLLSDIDGLIVPKTICFNPRTPDEVFQRISDLKWKYPVILREKGYHGGKSLLLLEAKNIYDIFFSVPLDGREFYLSQYIDCTMKDNIFHKYRIVVIRGVPFIRHLIISNNWIIHSSSRSFMQQNSTYMDQEKEVIDNFENSLKKRLSLITEQIYKKIGLDYFGIDCSITDEFITLFEVNINMNILVNTSPLPNIWEIPIKKIQTALIELINIKRIEI